MPRLWAQRKIAVLVDAIRTSGAECRGSWPPEVADPRVKELVDEIVRLSTEFGVLTEYTAFLAREGTDLTRREQVAAEAWRNFDTRARQVRSGLGAVNQDMNSRSQKSASQLNYRNAYWDANMDRAQIASVQQVADRAFYQKAGRWVDSRLVNQTDAGAALGRRVRLGGVPGIGSSPGPRKPAGQHHDARRDSVGRRRSSDPGAEPVTPRRLVAPRAGCVGAFVSHVGPMDSRINGPNAPNSAQ